MTRDKNGVYTLGEAPRVTEINDSVVSVLETALERAKKGEFAGVGVSAVSRDGSVSSHFSHTSDKTRLVAAVAALQFDLLHGWMIDNRESPVEPGAD